MDDFQQRLVGEMKKLKKYAAGLCRNSDLADDLVQDTLLRAIECRHQFQDGTNLAAWLFTICRNMFLSGARRGSRITDDPEGYLTAAVTSKDDGLASLIAKDLISFIVCLPAEHQQVLMMAASGMTYEDMSAQIGIPEGTIKSRLHRARVVLADLSGFEFRGALA